MKMKLSEKYGQWAVVAGGSEGMGKCFSQRLAQEGFNVVITARKQEAVDKTCRELEDTYHVKTIGISVDFSKDEAPELVFEKTKGLEVGFLVYNVGLAYAARFQTLNMEQELLRVNVNVRSMLALTLHYLPPMAERRRGGAIILSSNSGLVGDPYHTTYAASKAYAINLVESLWGELHDDFNLDLLAVCPGQTIGQSFADVKPGTYGFQTGAEVVAEAFESLGKDIVLVTSNPANQGLLATLYNAEDRKKGILEHKATAAQYLPENWPKQQ